MAKSMPFDATMRDLFELDPAAWLRFLNVSVAHPHRIEVKDSNLSTVSPEVGRVFWIGDDPPRVEHLELQAGRDLRLPDRVHWYSTILRHRYNVPIHSHVVLLRPEADGEELTGTYEQKDHWGVTYDWFRYDIMRIWERPVDEVLAAGLAVLPLAPVSDVAPGRLPEVLTAMARRFKQEAPPERAKQLWAAAKILMGLRYSEDQIDPMMERISAMILGIRGIEESTVYQGIFAKGEAKGKAEGLVEAVREDLLQLGKRKFGPPGREVEDRIAALGDVNRLRGLLVRIMDATTWEELLASLND